MEVSGERLFAVLGSECRISVNEAATQAPGTDHDYDRQKFGLTRRKALLGLGGIGAGAALGGAGTMAFLNDPESIENNVVTAGELDLRLDWKTYYNGRRVVEGDGFTPVQLEPTDTDGQAILKLDDVKPGDTFCITTSIHVYNNPAWIWMATSVTGDEEGTNTEPEMEMDEYAYTDDGELDDLLMVRTFYDDSLDCEYNGDKERAVNKWRRVSDWMSVADLSKGGILLDGVRNEKINSREDGATTPYYPTDESQTIHLTPFFPTKQGLENEIQRWWGGSPSSSLTDGQYGIQYVTFSFYLPKDVGNEIQGDTFELGLHFYAEQARHNGFPKSPWNDSLPEFSVDIVPGVGSQITGPGFTGDGDEDYYIKGVTGP
ncbi:SipW-dependent-type signal peptide-containing protein [Haladaptatus sp. NG-WS-4]